jgi:membrane-associated phospholipid phosphatase
VSTTAPHQPYTPSRPWSARRTWSLVALNSAWWQLVALGVLYYVCVRTATGQVREDQLHADALATRDDVPAWLGRVFGFAERLEPQHLLIGVVVVGALGLVRGRPGRAVQGIAVAAGTLGLTELLKLVLLERPDLVDGGYASNSLPSGHTAAVLGLALGALVASPRVLRFPVALVGAAAAGSMGAFVIADGWHRVSDVLASALVGSVVFCLVQVLPSRDRRARGALTSLAVTVPLACAAALVVVYAGSVDLVTAYVVAGAVVALTVLWAAAALPREVRRGA